MARLLGRASLQNLASSQSSSSIDTGQVLEKASVINNGLRLNMENTVPHVHFNTVIPQSDTSATTMTSNDPTIPQTQSDSSASQPYIMLPVADGTTGGSSQSTATRNPDLMQVLSSLQNGDLSSVLQQQPHLAQELSAIAAGEVCSNPESLKFQYDVESDHDPPTATGTTTAPKSFVYREQDRFLPIHNVSRIMRNSVPKNGKVSKDAKECMQECVSEFLSFITSEASDKCIQEKRKTITGDDILFAMATLGFDNHIEPLRVYLQKYREYTKADKIASPPPASLSEASMYTDQSHGASTHNNQGLRPAVVSVPATYSPLQQVTVTNVPTIDGVDPGIQSELSYSTYSTQQ